MDHIEDLGTLGNRLDQQVHSWVPGDLMGISDLKGSLEAFISHPGFPLLPLSFTKPLYELLGRIMDLLDDDPRERWMTDFRALEWPLVPADPPAPEVAEPDQAQTDETTSDGFPPDYFAQVISDPQLLSQLCDEVREHLDAAQFSLVELERDTSNHETVNRVFRSFHTLKSSAAFLGLKNIEEVAHVLEDLLVLVRDGKLIMGSELTDVIFLGIGLLRDLAGVIETSHYQVEAMVQAFGQMPIAPFIRSIRKILDEYKHRKLGEILLEAGLISPDVVGRVLETQRATGERFGDIAVNQKLVSPQAIELAVQRQNATPRKTTYVKVLNERLNALVDMVGELVVNQSMLKLYVSNPEAGRDAAERAVAQLETVTTGMKNLVLSMGMVSVSEIYNKLRVVVRNTATETGKVVSPEFFGEDTELDRNVIETIYDPLVHIVRNAIDHGLESPDDRERAGKSQVGTLRIRAEHRGNGIVLTLEDDGAGVSRERVIAKALAKGLVTEVQAPTLKDKEILDLLFLPGFSTKDVASEISGRGVGLDVVRQNIDQIHGKVEIESTPGKGTKFTIRIPLTLAIIDGFVTQVEETRYVFPFNLIEEIVVPHGDAMRVLDDGSHLLVSRGSHVPVILAGTIFGHKGYAGRTKPGLEGKLILLIGFGGRRYGIAVDGIVGKQEIVIKNLTEALAGIGVFSGGTIFGDGNIGFVVDVEEFIQAARKDGDEDTDRR